MKISDFLDPAHVLVEDNAADKSKLLWELCRRAAEALELDAVEISREIMKREALGTTGMGKGVAIPHARIANLDRPFGFVIRLNQPVNFEAIDSKPVDLIFLLLLPDSGGNGQINPLACVARKLRDPDSIAALRTAGDAGSLFAELTREVASK